MKLIAGGFIPGHRSNGPSETSHRSVIYEAQPTRRTFVTLSGRYFVSLPWVYYVVSYNETKAGTSNRNQRKRYQFQGLRVLIRGEAMTTTDQPLATLDWPNGGSGIICLGDALDTGTAFDTPEELAAEAISRFHDSAFESSSITLPLLKRPPVFSFLDWKTVSKEISPAVIPIDYGKMGHTKLTEVCDMEWFDVSGDGTPPATFAPGPLPRRYDHDTCCTFLGYHGEYDLYYCPQGGTIPTVIARYGNRGDEYYSGMAFGYLNNENHPLVVARKRAQEQSLDCQPDRYH